LGLLQPDHLTSKRLARSGSTDKGAYLGHHHLRIRLS
jgi:hypothetical protein